MSQENRDIWSGDGGDVPIPGMDQTISGIRKSAGPFPESEVNALIQKNRTHPRWMRPALFEIIRTNLSIST